MLSNITSFFCSPNTNQTSSTGIRRIKIVKSYWITSLINEKVPREKRWKWLFKWKPAAVLLQLPHQHFQLGTRGRAAAAAGSETDVSLALDFVALQDQRAQSDLWEPVHPSDPEQTPSCQPTAAYSMNIRPCFWPAAAYFSWDLQSSGGWRWWIWTGEMLCQHCVWKHNFFSSISTDLKRRKSI